MMDKKELNMEQLEQVNGGVSTIIQDGYWYGVYGDYNGFNYSNQRYGYNTVAEREFALCQAVEEANKLGVQNIRTGKGHI